VSRGAREIAAEISLRPRRSLAFWFGLTGTILAFVVGVPMPSWALFFIAIGIAQAVVGVLAGIQGFEGQLLRRFAAGVATPIAAAGVFVLVVAVYEGDSAGASGWFLVFLLFLWVLSFATALGLAVGRRLRPAGASLLTSQLREPALPNRLAGSPRQTDRTGDHRTQVGSRDGDLGLDTLGVAPETDPVLAEATLALDVETGRWRRSRIVRRHPEDPDELRIGLETAVMRDHGYEMAGRERVVGPRWERLVALLLAGLNGPVIDTAWIDVTYERVATEGAQSGSE
jgi:hypothetical protein